VSSSTLLELRDLRVGLRTRRTEREIVRGVNSEVSPGEKLGIVGESGSGKTLTILSVLGLLPAPLRLLSGQVRFDGTVLSALGERHLRHIRGAQVAMVYQGPMTSLNPLLRVRTQVVETLRAHGSSPADALARCREALSQVGLPARAERTFPTNFPEGCSNAS
jgi:ABC-type microcin C transport system duplicated ATPase subunit YejF